MVETFLPRFSVEQSVGGYQNLIITNVSFADAGLYTCFDKSGLGSMDDRHYASAQLTVIGKTAR